MPELSNGREERFCHEYVARGMERHGTESAIAAGYSPKSAHVTACRKLKQVNIQTRIREILREQMSDVDLLTYEWLRQAKRLLFADPRDLYDDNGNMINPKDLDDDVAAAVQEIIDSESEKTFQNGNIERNRIHKMKLADKNTALVTLGRYLAILNDAPPEPADPAASMSRAERKERLVYLLNKARGEHSDT